MRHDFHSPVYAESSVMYQKPWLWEGDSWWNVLHVSPNEKSKMHSSSEWDYTMISWSHVIIIIIHANTHSFNPILTGGLISPPPPPVQNPRHTFSLLFFFKSKFAKNRTIGREVTWRFVLARRHKICPKTAFCIHLCTKHMEITNFIKMP